MNSRASTEPGHLLLVSLGPIQDFIASARRCQDLWFGSWMLSDLARAVAAKLEAELGMEALIFPAGLAEDKPGVANKILAVVPSGKKPEEVAEQGRAAMRERLDALAKEAFDRVDTRYFLLDAAERQVRDLMEYLWVAVPFDGEGYPQARERAEFLLAARKNTRPWGPVGWGAPVPKSSLDGLRESVYHEDLYGRGVSDEARRTRYFVKGKERLCGVGVLKRVGSAVDIREGGDADTFGGRARPTFHSTSQVAAAPLLVRVAGLEAFGEVNAWFQALLDAGVNLDRFRVRSGGPRVALRDPLGEVAVTAPCVFGGPVRGGWGYDGSLLFEDRLPSVIKGYSQIPAADAAAVERRLRKRLQHLLRDSLGLHKPPTPYYAILLADGDKMGKALDGLARQGLEAHRAFSQALDGFTRSCQRIVPEHAGSLLYAGGDDVLALLPLHTVLQCAEALKDAFHEAIKGCFLEDKGLACPTLSVGVGVTHHMDPMSMAREVANDAERLAKVERNSLAIIVAKRGGAPVSACAPWPEVGPGKPIGLSARIWRWVGLFENEDLPDKAAFELERCLLPLRDERGRPVEGMERVAESLARRALARRRAKRGEEPIAEQIRDELKARFLDHPDPVRAGLSLSAELQIARLFLDAWQDAWGWQRREEA